MSPNKPNKWIIVLGAPNPGHPRWENETPSKGQCQDVWYMNKMFGSKTNAQVFVSKNLWDSPFHVRVQKYNPRKIAGVLVLP